MTLFIEYFKLYSRKRILRPRESLKSSERYDENRDSKHGSRKSSASSKKSTKKHLKKVSTTKKSRNSNYPSNDIHRKKTKKHRVNAFAGGKDNQNLSVQKTLKDKITDKDNDDVLSVEEFLDLINDSSRTKSKTKSFKKFFFFLKNILN